MANFMNLFFHIFPGHKFGFLSEPPPIFGEAGRGVS